MEFQRYEYLSRRQSPGLSESELIFLQELVLRQGGKSRRDAVTECNGGTESPTATKWRAHAPNRGCRLCRLGLEGHGLKESELIFYIHGCVYKK